MRWLFKNHFCKKIGGSGTEAGCLTSIHQAEQLKGLASLSSRVKPGNEKVYYIIDSIHSAILEHRQIEFQYYEYTQTKEKILKT